MSTFLFCDLETTGLFPVFAHRLLWRNYGCIAGEAESLRPLLDETACMDYKGTPKRTRAGALAEVDRLESERAADAGARLALRELPCSQARISRSLPSQ